MEKELETIVKKYLKQGSKIDNIQEVFSKIVNKIENKPTLKKTKKNRKKICRPVLLISDSSCDDFDNINN
tara:strand:+ start:36 stop:245 length:210 start_codon:yes stop_codon:yes gene_type:complete